MSLLAQVLQGQLQQQQGPLGAAANAALSQALSGVPSYVPQKPAGLQPAEVSDYMRTATLSPALRAYEEELKPRLKAANAAAGMTTSSQAARVVTKPLSDIGSQYTASLAQAQMGARNQDIQNQMTIEQLKSGLYSGASSLAASTALGSQSSAVQGAQQFGNASFQYGIPYTQPSIWSSLGGLLGTAGGVVGGSYLSNLLMPKTGGTA